MKTRPVGGEQLSPPNSTKAPDRSSASSAPKPAAPVYGLTMRPRKRLFIGLCVMFAAWLAFLVWMWRLK